MSEKKVRLSIALTPEMVHHIDVLRSLSGTSRAGFIRLALADYLKPYPVNEGATE